MEKRSRVKSRDALPENQKGESQMTRFSEPTPGYYVVMNIAGTETGVSQFLQLVHNE